MVIVLDPCTARPFPGAPFMAALARDLPMPPSCGSRPDKRFYKAAFSYIHLARIATC
jgi:hypothetical protein